MNFVRRTEGVKNARLVFKRAREDSRSQFHVYVAAALMEYYCSKDPPIAMRIFDLGLKKHNDPDFALAYVDFLSHLNEDNNTRVVFERILNSGTLSAEKSADIWDRYLEFESQVGDLTSILKVDKRRRDAAKDLYDDKQALFLIDRYKFLNLVPCTPEQLKFMGYNKQVKHPTGGYGFAATSSVPNGRPATAVPPPGHVGLEISGFPQPDTDQMLPFKPKLPPCTSYHPVPGGVFPPPPAAAWLMQQLPPPWTFVGPFPDVDRLMESLANFNREPPRANMRDVLDANAAFNGYKAADVKKEFYQLLTTTNDPAVVMASQEYQQSTVNHRKRVAAGNDSDSDDDTSRYSSVGDIYKRRMHMKTAD
jgi:cleavage stimulation factor subunit 3